MGVYRCYNGDMTLFTEDLYKKVTRYSTHWVPPESNILARSIGYHRVKNMIGRNIPDDVIQQLIDIKKMYCKKKYEKVVAKAIVRKEASKNGEFSQFCTAYLTKYVGKVYASDIQALLIYQVDWLVVSKKIQCMPYAKFLYTRYWKIIRAHKLFQSNYICSLCGSPKHLQVHHITYEHHGDELHALDDLIVVCKLCHKKIHNKL